MMRAISSALWCLSLAACCPAPRTARVDTVFGSYNPNAADGRGGFTHLKSLVGNWEAAREDQKQVRASYKLISGDSVLMETYATPSGRETMTAYHPDGPRLMLTHYCAQGNQPRLQATVVAPEYISFKYFDASNLANTQDRLVRLELSFKDANTFERSETYHLATGGVETTVLVFHRIEGATKT